MTSIPLSSHALECDSASCMNAVNYRRAMTGYGGSSKCRDDMACSNGRQSYGAPPALQENDRRQHSYLPHTAEKALQVGPPHAFNEVVAPPPPQLPVNSGTVPAAGFAASRSEGAQRGCVNNINCYESSTWHVPRGIQTKSGVGKQQVPEARNTRSITNGVLQPDPNSYGHNVPGANMSPYSYGLSPFASIPYSPNGRVGYPPPQSWSSAPLHYPAPVPYAPVATAAAVAAAAYHNYGHHHHHQQQQQHQHQYHHQQYYHPQSQRVYGQHHGLFHGLHYIHQQHQQNKGMGSSFAPVLNSAASRTDKNEAPITEVLNPVCHTGTVPPVEEAGSLPGDFVAEGVPSSDDSGHRSQLFLLHEEPPLSESDSISSRRFGADHAGGHAQVTTAQHSDGSGSSSVKSSWGQCPSGIEALTFSPADVILCPTSFGPRLPVASTHVTAEKRGTQLPSYEDTMASDGLDTHHFSPIKAGRATVRAVEPPEDSPGLSAGAHKREVFSMFSAGNLQEQSDYEDERKTLEYTRGVLGNGRPGSLVEEPPRVEAPEVNYSSPSFTLEAPRSHHHHYFRQHNVHHHLQRLHHLQHQQQLHQNPMHLLPRPLSAGALKTPCTSPVHRKQRSFNAMVTSAAISPCASGTQESGASRMNNNVYTPLASGASMTLDSGCGANGNPHLGGGPGSMRQQALPINDNALTSHGSKGEGPNEHGSAAGAILKGTSAKPSSFRTAPLGAALYEHCGVQEDLFEERASEVLFDVSSYGNIVSFLNAVSPVVEADKEMEWVIPLVGETAAAPGREELGGDAPLPTYREPSIPLLRIWKALDLPFACTIPFAEPVSLAPMRPPEEHVVYTPFLSGFRLCFSEASPTYAKLKSLRQNADVALSTAFSSDPIHRAHMPSSSLDAGTVGKPEVSGEEGSLNFSSSAAALTSSTMRGATQDSGEEASYDAEVGFVTWGATERPDQRSLLLEQVHELAASNDRYSVLLSAATTELDNQSWFAVLWQPVYDQSHTAKHSCGSFIVYYALRPPRHMEWNQTSSQVARMNSDWMSPVFRCDRQGVHWDMWAQNDSILLPLSLSPSTCEGNSDFMMRQQGVSSLDKTSTTATDSNGEMHTVMEASSASVGSHDVKFGYSGQICTEAFANDVSRGSQHVLPASSSEKAVTGHATARIPIIGLIPGRCRADVWYVPCSGMDIQDPNTGRSKSSNGAASRRRYRAPLFLLTAALQLMSWNAQEGVWKQIMRKKGLGVADGVLAAAWNAAEPPVPCLRGNTTTTTTTTTAAASTAARSFLAKPHKPKCGKKLLVEGAHGYRSYRESVNADAVVTPTAPSGLQEGTDSNCSTVSSPTTAGTELSAIVEGLPDFYQWVQFDGPLLGYVERYA
ncbi:hypothetical protein TRSC58_05391 [Trypanosoma rangeli SC58]|uniref:Uncharacterized protein n=1 Tax=Trypanosoma rangeli SC58 TaxID=429131 RepID=A0A061J0V7_TRYRA|nr:hypothetical protein TRSC58_05391 [Trypanosoma rangeli SC58]